MARLLEEKKKKQELVIAIPSRGTQGAGATWQCNDLWWDYTWVNKKDLVIASVAAKRSHMGLRMKEQDKKELECRKMTP